MVEEQMFRQRQQRLYDLALERCRDIASATLGGKASWMLIEAEAEKYLQRELVEASIVKSKLKEKADGNI